MVKIYQHFALMNFHGENPTEFHVRCFTFVCTVCASMFDPQCTSVRQVPHHMVQVVHTLRPYVTS